MKFAQQTAEDQKEIIKLAFSLLETDSFFITAKGDKASVFLDAVGTATNKFLQGRFHDKFGPRSIY